MNDFEQQEKDADTDYIAWLISHVPKKEEKFYRIGQKLTHKSITSLRDVMLICLHGHILLQKINRVILVTENGSTYGYYSDVQDLHKITEAEMKPFFDAGFSLKEEKDV